MSVLHYHITNELHQLKEKLVTKRKLTSKVRIKRDMRLP